jgi:hypothetical protein
MIRIEFDNDTYTRFTDRNLYFYSVIVNERVFPASSENVICYFRSNGKYFFHQRLNTTTATYAAHFLKENGIPDSLVFPVETRHKIKSKTFTMALDVKAWLEKQRPGERPAITVFTEETHARRSYLSFARAFGNSAEIGVAGCSDKEMNRSNWWKSRKGWRTILYETIGIVWIGVFV